MTLYDDRNPLFRGIVDVAFALRQRPNATPIIGDSGSGVDMVHPGDR